MSLLVNAERFSPVKTLGKDDVFICNSTGAKKYHSIKDCKGLTNCTHGVIEVTKAKAIDMGRTPCKICW